MATVADLLECVEKVDLPIIIQTSIEETAQDYIELNTNQQLFKGIDADGTGFALAVGNIELDDLRTVLREFATDALPTGPELALSVINKLQEKHDQYLPENLLCEEYAARNFDVDGLLRWLQGF